MPSKADVDNHLPNPVLFDLIFAGFSGFIFTRFSSLYFFKSPKMNDLKIFKNISPIY